MLDGGGTSPSPPCVELDRGAPPASPPSPAAAAPGPVGVSRSRACGNVPNDEHLRMCGASGVGGAACERLSVDGSLGGGDGWGARLADVGDAVATAGVTFAPGAADDESPALYARRLLPGMPRARAKAACASRATEYRRNSHVVRGREGATTPVYAEQRTSTIANFFAKMTRSTRALTLRAAAMQMKRNHRFSKLKSWSMVCASCCHSTHTHTTPASHMASHGDQGGR